MILTLHKSIPFAILGKKKEEETNADWLGGKRKFIVLGHWMMILWNTV